MLNIAVVLRYVDMQRNDSWDDRWYIMDDFMNMAKKFGVGMVAVMNEEAADTVWKYCDGLIIPGSATDIDPSYFGGKPFDPPTTVDEYALDATLMKRFYEAGKPIFGVCGGEQAINVYFGGTLNQNIEGHREGRHIVENLPGTWCSDILGPSVETNSSHHQSLKEPGDGVVVCARAFDTPGTIEAIRQEHLPVYAVQWHPENKPHDVGDTLLRGWLKITQIHKSVDQFLKSGVWQ